VVVGTLVACSRDEPTAASTPTTKASTASECSDATALKVGTSTHKLTSHGFDREYLVYAPKSYTGRTKVPVVLEFHGFGGSAQQQLLYGNLGPQSERDGFLVVAPQGQGQPQRFTLLGPAGSEQDDVVFVADLLDHIQKTLCIDPARVYSTGMSNGGAMTAVLACRLSDRIAAFASVAAVVWGPSARRRAPCRSSPFTASRTRWFLSTVAA
jgi:polyhydroxybutyrate depolymerase